MDARTNPQGMQKPASPTVAATSSGSRKDVTRPRPVEVIGFVIGVIILAVASVLVHSHPQPYLLDLETTLTVQHTHPYPWINPCIDFVSALNDPIPSIVALALWAVSLVIIGLFVRSRGKSPIKWLQSAVALVLTVAVAGGINFIINTLVARPRPLPTDCLAPKDCITVLNTIPVHSFPSGHTEHDMAYYGFLLYLSFSQPVRTWPYRRTLIPFQILAVVDILTIGYSRILEGEHWLTDVLAGYLSGALWLFLCILLYRWITTIIAQRSEQAMSVLS